MQNAYFVRDFERKTARKFAREGGRMRGRKAEAARKSARAEVTISWRHCINVSHGLLTEIFQF